MTAPITNFETAGDWTSLAQEAAFLDQIVAETDVTTGVAGQSVEGRDIRWFSLGGGDRTLLVSGLVHGNEPAGREAVLAWMRDIAYSPDAGLHDFLQTHRVVWVPTVSPDVLLVRRDNVLSKNPNRTYYTLIAETPETRAMVTVMNLFSPEMVVDCHEYYGSGADWRGFQSHMPGIRPGMRALEQDLFDQGLAVASQHGYTAEQYPMNIVPRACTTAYASTRHAVGLTSETNFRDGTPPDRVTVHINFLRRMWDWYVAHAAEITAARQEALAWAVESAGEDSFLIRQQYVGTDSPETVRLAGYQLQEPLDPYLVDMHGIVIDEDLFAPMQQSARMILPQIFDPDAMDRQVVAVRVARVDPDPEPVPPREPLPNRPLVSMRLHVGGRTREIIGMKIQTNGRSRGAVLAGR